MSISFNNASVFRKDLIEELLVSGYSDIPTTTQKDKQDFKKFSEDVHEHPEWLGKYIFITTIDDMPIGFVSFDPRQKPVATIGHNSILPEYKGKGVGRLQMMHALDEIKVQGFAKAIVSTCTNEYFVPAQKMYKACGFKETGKFYKKGSDIEMVGYELDLK